MRENSRNVKRTGRKVVRYFQDQTLPKASLLAPLSFVGKHFGELLHLLRQCGRRTL